MHFVEFAWVNPEVEGSFLAQSSSQEAVDLYYDKPLTGCPAAKFQIRSSDGTSLCWGGYVIIGVAVATVVIIVIIVGVSRACFVTLTLESIPNKLNDL